MFVLVMLCPLPCRDLSTNAFTGPLPPCWSALGALTSLHADSNVLTGPLPPQWGALGALQELGLGRNALRGSVPPEWGRAMRSLRWVADGSNNDNVTRAGPCMR